MKGNDFGFYSRLLGIAPGPSTTALRKLYGFEPPPVPIPTLPPVPLSTLMRVPNALSQVPAPAGIHFQSKRFSEPTKFRSTWLPILPGLYAILVRDAKSSPRPFRVIYFGKAENLASRVVPSHEKCDQWCRVAGGGENLYVACCEMRNSTDDERRSAEADLISHYAPECNDVFNPFSAWLGGK
jgi:hypothetical protein